jgi:hypothetical protein
MKALSNPECFDSIESYMSVFVDDMASKAQDGLPPLFDPKTERLSENVRQCSGAAMSPYPAQAAVIESCVRLLRQNNSAWIVGEMGTGKTCMGAWLVAAHERDIGHKLRVVVTAPNHLVKKWQSHFRKIIPGCRAVIVNSISDLSTLRESSVVSEKEVCHADGSITTQKNRRWAPPSTTEIYILPRDKGKLGYSWRAAVDVSSRLEPTIIGQPKARVETYKCPGCGGIIAESRSDLLSLMCNKKGKLGSKRCCDAEVPETAKNKVWDPEESKWVCGTPLWQAFNGQSRGADALPVPGVSPRRMAPCQYLRKIGAQFDLYLPDEVHELKGRGTLQGRLYADLCSMSKKVVPLTGTLVGGYAENLTQLLWRTCPNRMVDDGQVFSYGGDEDFVKEYGVLQERRRFIAESDFQSSNDLVMGRGKQSSVYTRSLPGISPVLYTNFLLDQAVFIRLADMHDHLPRFDEKVHRVGIDADVDQELKRMQDAFDEHLDSTRRSTAWAKARSTFLRYPDKPWVDPYDVYHIDHETQMPVHVFGVNSLPPRETPKARRVRRLIHRNMLRGRKTWVFTELTGKSSDPAWDWMTYYKEYLSEYGIRVGVMRSTADGGPKPIDREAWIEKHAPDCDVIISHPQLVQTGLDLFDFPSLIFAFPGDNTYRLRQASRRAWRLGQQFGCEVDYVVSAGTASRSVQDAALALMADKMAASLALEGDFTSEGLAAMSGGEDVASKLAKFIAGELTGLDSKASFGAYRKQFDSLLPDLGVSLEPAAAAEPPPNMSAPDREDPTVVARAPAAPAVAFADKKEVVADPSPYEPPMKKASVEGTIAERRALRKEAFMLALGIDGPDEEDGEWLRIGLRWYFLVTKARRTVRGRNFAVFYKHHPDGAVAFVEPVDDVGPNSGFIPVEHAGISYAVSFMRVSAYMEGERSSCRHWSV